MFSRTLKISDPFNLLFIFFFPVLLFFTKIYSAWKTYFDFFFLTVASNVSSYPSYPISSLVVIYFHLLKTISLRTLED